MKKIFTFALMLTMLLASSTVFALSIYYPTDGIYSIQPKFALNKELSVQSHASNWGVQYETFQNKKIFGGTGSRQCDCLRRYDTCG